MNSRTLRPVIRRSPDRHNSAPTTGRSTPRTAAFAVLAVLTATAMWLTRSTASAATPPPTTVTSTFQGGSAVVPLSNGTQLWIGGCGPNHCATVLSAAVIYNPKTRTSTPTGRTVSPHASATATLLPSGQVLLAGGCMGRLCGQENPTSELWNPTTGQWKTSGNLQTTATYGLSPISASAVLLASGKVLVAGGTNYETIAQTFNPATGNWTLTAPMHAARESFTLITLTSGKILAAGGCDDYYCQTILRTAEIYNPSTGVWTTTGNLTQARYDHSATLLGTGQVRITGGLNAAGTAATPNDTYNPSSGTWSTT